MNKELSSGRSYRWKVNLHPGLRSSPGFSSVIIPVNSGRFHTPQPDTAITMFHCGSSSVFWLMCHDSFQL